MRIRGRMQRFALGAPLFCVLRLGSIGSIPCQSTGCGGACFVKRFVDNFPVRLRYQEL